MNHQGNMSLEDTPCTQCNSLAQTRHCKFQHDKQTVFLSQCHWDSNSPVGTELVEWIQPGKNYQQYTADKPLREMTG